MIENLGILYDEGILMERPRDRDKYELVKGDIYVIAPECKWIGLGWDASRGGDDIDVMHQLLHLMKRHHI